MGTLYNSLEIARRALSASQTGLSVTAHNIANINTPGYTRQRVNLSEAPPIVTGSGVIGRGVQVDSITSFRDRFIESRIMSETAFAGKLTAYRDSLQQVEVVFNELNTAGLDSQISAFFNSFSRLASNPQSLTLRNIVVQSGKALADQFRSQYGRLQQIQTASDQKLAGLASEANSLIQSIAKLNAEIGAAEIGGQRANDLRDQRGEALRELSQLININVIELDGGGVSVTTTNGNSLIIGDRFESLITGTEPATGLAKITLGTTDITDEITGGQIAGLLQTRNQEIPGALKALDDLAASIIENVNTVHRTGQGLDGSTGTDFFNPFTQPAPGDNTGAARSIAVSNTVANDLNKIAAAQDGSAGDNANANAIADLVTSSVTIGGTTQTFGQFLAGMVADIGQKLHAAGQQIDTQDALLQQLHNQRDAISGVSLDEEAINLVQFQRSFEAAGRLFRVVNDLTEEVINLVR